MVPVSKSSDSEACIRFSVETECRTYTNVYINAFYTT